jgi:hypothetical protein
MNLCPVEVGLTKAYLDFDFLAQHRTEFSYVRQLLTEIIFKAMAAPGIKCKIIARLFL